MTSCVGGEAICDDSTGDNLDLWYVVPYGCVAGLQVFSTKCSVTPPLSSLLVWFVATVIPLMTAIPKHPMDLGKLGSSRLVGRARECLGFVVARR